MSASVLHGGFAEPALDAARAFRAALEAMARPGTIHTVAGAQPPAPLSVAAGVLLLTLCDPETPLYLAGALDRADLRQWLGFHTGAPLVGAAEAMFAVGPWADLMPLDRYAIGTPDYPDRSATLIVEMPALTTAGAVLTGPGIRERATLGLPDGAAMARNAALFPLGLDFYLCTGDRLAALPRSTRIEEVA